MSTTIREIVDLQEKVHKPGKVEYNSGWSGPVDLFELSAPLDVRLVSSNADFDAIKEDWENLIERPGVRASVFQTYQWQRIWWHYFGSAKELHIISIWDQDRLVGILPFFVDSTSVWGLFDFNQLKLLGSEIPGSKGIFATYSPTDYLDIIIDPDYRGRVVETILSYLKRSQTFCDQIELNELSEEGSFMREVMPQITGSGWSYEKTEREVCPRIVLQDSMDSYLDSLDRKVRYELRYAKRAVTEKRLFRVEEVTDEHELQGAFQHFVDLHQERWNKQGFPGIFADEGFTEFLKEISRTFLRKRYLKFTLAFDEDDRCIAVDYAFKFQNTVYNYQKAFDIESDLAKYGPGKALLYFLIEDSAEKGGREVDLLRGGEKYKMRIANAFSRNWMIKISNKARINSMKHRLFRIYGIMNKIAERFRRESLLLKIHYRQFGRLQFIPRYWSFMKERIRETADQ